MARLFQAAPTHAGSDWPTLHKLSIAMDGSMPVERLILLAENMGVRAARRAAGGAEQPRRACDALAALVGRHAARRSPWLAQRRRG